MPINRSAITNSFSIQTGTSFINGNNVLTLVTDTPFSGEIRTYSSLNEVALDFADDTSAYKYGKIHFAQVDNNVTPAIRPHKYMVTDVGSSSGSSGYLLTIDEASLTPSVIQGMQGITTGSFAIDVDGSTESVTALDFSTITNSADVITIIDTALQTCSLTVDGGKLKFTSKTTGSSSTVDNLTSAASGQDISLIISARAGNVAVAGTDGGSIVSRLQDIETSDFSNSFLALVITVDFTDVPQIKDAISYANSLNKYLVFRDAIDTDIVLYFPDGANDSFMSMSKVLTVVEAYTSSVGTSSAIASQMMSNPVGSLNAKFRIPKLTGAITPTSNDLDFYINHGVNVFTSVGENTNTAFYKNGVAAVVTNNSIDISVILGQYWLNINLYNSLYNLLISEGKVPLSGRGISKITAVIYTVLNQATTQGIITTNVLGETVSNVSAALDDAVHNGVIVNIDYLAEESVKFISNYVLMELGGTNE